MSSTALGLAPGVFEAYRTPGSAVRQQTYLLRLKRTLGPTQPDQPEPESRCSARRSRQVTGSLVQQGGVVGEQPGEVGENHPRLGGCEPGVPRPKVRRA